MLSNQTEIRLHVLFSDWFSWIVWFNKIQIRFLCFSQQFFIFLFTYEFLMIACTIFRLLWFDWPQSECVTVQEEAKGYDTKTPFFPATFFHESKFYTPQAYSRSRARRFSGIVEIHFKAPLKPHRFPHQYDMRGSKRRPSN